MLIKLISKVPEDLFKNAKREIDAIEWNSIIDERSSRSIAFSSSKSVQIRIHKQPTSPLNDIHKWGEIVETVNHPKNYKNFSSTIILSNWVKEKVNGIHIGRVFITNLSANSIIHPHIDFGRYFEVHSRFHIPIKTNSLVNFSSGPNEPLEHMPKKWLCRLNNSSTHYLENKSNENRIHLIVDVKLSQENTNQNFSSFNENSINSLT